MPPMQKLPALKSSAGGFLSVAELLQTPDGDDLKALIGDKDPAKIFGKMLQKRKNKVIHGHKITREEPRGRVNRWRLTTDFKAQRIETEEI